MEDTGRDESTSRVEGSGATNVQVRLIERLQNSQEVSTLHLDVERDADTQKDREKDHNVRIVEDVYEFITYTKQGLFYVNLV